MKTAARAAVGSILLAVSGFALAQEPPPPTPTPPAATPAQQPLRLLRSDCSSLDLTVEPTVWRVNDVREFSGHIALLCAAADGTQV